MKIKVEKLFNSKLDLRDYLIADIRDEDRDSLSYYHDIPDWVIDEVLDCVQIYVNGNDIDKEVELPK
ncbi:hypothetical protein IWT140_02213 [Secundilactobacillus pentosiphilus]|uniref:Uncharacterized protein n=1 Tax=Secundilactobacillus pentosiphilus TaxID=1714682 RepID=A0A1Z5IT21_9LACO|nr:hypothetical protein [Secundilactobacillus pentosiphilus]GAX04571.1 hypothetical protein IWT140_02213 [Secundilactobacillus pentosiphilus]